MKMEEEMK